MDHFLYNDGALHAEDVPVADIAASVGTPFYLYSTATLLRHYHLFSDALEGVPHLVCYAMKAASNQAILKTLAKAGAGMDVVSGGEYARARAAGVPGERIVFSGVGKTADEIRAALAGGIRQFNVESEPEMRLMSAIASEMGKVAPITVRVNPDVDAKTHARRSLPASPRTSLASRSAEPAEVYAGWRPRTPRFRRWWGLTSTSARQLTDLAPLRDGVSQGGGVDRDVLRGRRPSTSDRLDLGGGLGHSLYERSNEAPPLPARSLVIMIKTHGWSSGTARSRSSRDA